MDPNQYTLLTESLYLCNKLHAEMELDKDRIQGCLNDELRRAYLEANDAAGRELSAVKRRLQALTV